MNRHQRRQEQHAQKADLREKRLSLSETLTPIPPEEFPPTTPLPSKAWCSRKYLVQLYSEENAQYPGMMRMSVCRTTRNSQGGWKDGLTWDELQAIKREIGFGDWYAVEVYPPDQDVVNVANFRHLWLLPVPLSIGFK